MQLKRHVLTTKFNCLATELQETCSLFCLLSESKTVYCEFVNVHISIRCGHREAVGLCPQVHVYVLF